MLIVSCMYCLQCVSVRFAILGLWLQHRKLGIVDVATDLADTQDGSITILTANCRGLGNLKKRKDVFSFRKSKSVSVYCLQDTHFTKESENVIRSM